MQLLYSKILAKKFRDPSQVEAERSRLGPFQVLDLNNIDPTWLTGLKRAYDYPHKNRLHYDFEALDMQIQRAHNAGYLNPRVSNLWSWTKSVPIDRIRVIIVGDEPCNQVLSSGMAFHPLDEFNVSQSTKIVFDQLKEEFGCPHLENLPRKNHSLQGWMDQGVLMLNVHGSRNNYPNATYNRYPHHTWLPILRTLFNHIYDSQPHVIFMLVGSLARDGIFYSLETKNESDSRIVLAQEPSEVLDGRFLNFAQGLSQVNELITREGTQDPIDWTKLDMFN